MEFKSTCLSIYLSNLILRYTVYIKIKTPCCDLLFVNHCNIWLVSHPFITLDMKVPSDLSFVILNHLWRCRPFWHWSFQSILKTDFFIHYSRHLVVALHACRACLYLTPHCDVLGTSCLISPHLSGVIDPDLYWPGSFFFLSVHQ